MLAEENARIINSPSPANGALLDAGVCQGPLAASAALHSAVAAAYGASKYHTAQKLAQ